MSRDVEELLRRYRELHPDASLEGVFAAEATRRAVPSQRPAPQTEVVTETEVASPAPGR